MANAVYNSFKKKIMQGLIALDSDTLKVALCTVSYTPNIDTDTFYSDLTNEVANGNGYTTGGNTLAGQSLTIDTANDRCYLDGTDSTWPSSTFTCRYAVLYKSTGVAGTSPLIGYFDLGANKSPAGDTLTLQWATPATGAILYFA